MALPTLQTERKIKYENTTTYIKNSGLNALFEVIFINLKSVINRKVSE